MAEREAEILLDFSEENRYRLRSLKGPVCWGYCFSLDLSLPVLWEYNHLTRGFLGTGKEIFLFSIQTRKPDSEAEREVLKVLRTASWEDGSPPSPDYSGLSQEITSGRSRRPYRSSGFSEERYEYSRTSSCEWRRERAEDYNERVAERTQEVEDHNEEVDDLVDEYKGGRISCEEFEEEYSDIQKDYEDLYD